jgi:transposase-like protein
MGREPRADRSAEEKWQIVQEGIKSGNVSETCRRYSLAATLFYRWKDEAEQGANSGVNALPACPMQNLYGVLAWSVILSAIHLSHFSISRAEPRQSDGVSRATVCARDAAFP